MSEQPSGFLIFLGSCQREMGGEVLLPIRPVRPPAKTLSIPHRARGVKMLTPLAILSLIRPRPEHVPTP